MVKIKHYFLFACLLFFSVIANLAIKIVPFKKLMKWLTNCDEYEHVELTVTQKGRIRKVIKYLELIEKITPWRVMCFEQAVTTLVLCRILKVNVCVYFGVKRENDGKLIAHAWTVAGGYFLSGGISANRFTVVYERALDCRLV